MILDIYKKPFHILSSEFNKITHHEFNNLIIYEKLGLYERIHGLIRDLAEFLEIQNLIWNAPTHGGYSLVECSPLFKNIHVSNIEPNQIQNINENLLKYEIKNIVWFDPSMNMPNSIYFTENPEQMDIIFIEKQEPIIICPMRIGLIQHPTIKNIYPMQLQLTGTDMMIFIPAKVADNFKTQFSAFLYPANPFVFSYDNLIELCIMVKDGGDQFEETLKANLHLVDHWTILDTGSTDNTLEIVNRVLGPKKGRVYQEPFLNFRDSRNRCLELAGTRCKYTLMLDDTYRIQGDLRKFLNTVRGDQFSDSFSLYIQSDDVQYATNRILITERKLKYLYKLHEVIQPDNNMNVIIPNHVSNIFDYRCDYMETRTIERKDYDLKILFEEIEENPNDPRCYYYIAQTYNIMGKHELAYEYYLKRAYHPVEGFIQEKIDATFEGARTANFKLNLPWEICENLYTKAYELDKSRPDSLYFLGIHHFLEKNMQVAFDYFKEAFRVGYPIHCQYSLKPTLSFYFLPKFLVELCILFEEWELGKNTAELFLRTNKKGSDFYDKMEEWYKLINDKLNISIEEKIPVTEESKLQNNSENITMEIVESET